MALPMHYSLAVAMSYAGFSWVHVLGIVFVTYRKNRTQNAVMRKLTFGRPLCSKQHTEEVREVM